MKRKDFDKNAADLARRIDILSNKVKQFKKKEKELLRTLLPLRKEYPVLRKKLDEYKS